MTPVVGSRPWTPEEDERLRILIEARTSIALVAAKLKRSVPAVRARARMLRISLKRFRIRSRADHRV